MNAIISKLVWKDLLIMKMPTFWWWVCGILAIAVAVTGGQALLNLSIILFISGMAGVGIHTIMRTVVEERREKTLPFIMSLPITISDYTSAKLISNLLIFGVVWGTLSLATYVMIFTSDVLPVGNIPFLTIVFATIFLANIIVLTISLVTETIGGCIAAIIGANIGAQLFLWAVVDLDGIRSTINGPEAVWSETALVVLAVQLLIIILLVGFAYVFQTRKKDFI